MVDFTPLRFFRSGHRQTILGYLVRLHQREPRSWRRLILLPDGDKLHTYESAPPGWQPDHPIALIVHGLGGSHRSGSVVRLTWELLKHGVGTVRIDLRGCGESMPDSKVPYHAGCSGDIAWVLRDVRHRFPDAPLCLIGLSLGGNIVLKLAGEANDGGIPQLAKVVAVAPPIDLQRCSTMLRRPENAAYERRFVRDLRDLAIRRARTHGEPVPKLSPRLSLRQFDDLYTAPRCGFADVTDYYRRASSLPVLARIVFPTTILLAEDDPIVDAGSLRNASLSRFVTGHLTKHGGHLGYVSSPRNGGWCWLEKFVLHQLLHASNQQAGMANSVHDPANRLD